MDFKNKRGFMGIVVLVGALFLLVMFGLVMGLGSSVINWVFDETVPELNALGQVGDWNATETMEFTVGPVNSFVQSWTWVTGVVYLLALSGIFGLAFAFRMTGDKWLMGLFFGLVLILVIGCIFMSNIYEDIYRGNDEFSEIVREHTMLSFLIMYSPGIMAIIAFIAGIILFSGEAGGVI